MQRGKEILSREITRVYIITALILSAGVIALVGSITGSILLLLAFLISISPLRKWLLPLPEDEDKSKDNQEN